MNQLKIELTEKVIERFWNKVDVCGTEECWEWRAHKDKCGYGKIKINSKMYLAHRVSWSIYNVQILDGLCVCHSCDNPGCVNPAHLFLGTHTDNMRDMKKKHRGVTPDNKGEKNGSTKLTEQQVMEIREKYVPLIYTMKMLAKEYGVHLTTIHYIVERITWKHVT